MATSITTRREIGVAGSEKVRENRLRRMAERQGLGIRKVRRRDPRALDYGTWTIYDLSTNAVVAGERMSIDEVEAYLTGGK
jgi:hypothetical protein